jgi:ABC-type bacteriocin/lantibiotic exporter with double-glycine peptidase domain
MGSSQLTMADYGCLVTSVAMMATHAGKNLKPSDIANTPSAFFSPNAQTALLYWQFSVNGININLNNFPVSQLDQKLSSGPVIVGLYSGPDHYVVLKSGSGGNYIMNDPFLENGGDRNFTDTYSVSNISLLFTVSFN